MSLDEAVAPAPGRSSVRDPAAAAPPTGAVPGTVRISDTVVAKLAARAAAEVPDVGGTASRVLGRMGAGRRQLPRTSVHVDGQRAFVEMAISVRWPASVVEVTQLVRARVSDRLRELTELTVADFQITVADLITQVEAGPRVR